VSQMPEVPGSWPEEGAQYVPGAPMEPVQQAYPPQAPYQQQQPYQQQGYQDPQYQQAQQQYAQQQYQDQQYQEQQQYPQEQTVPQQMVFEEEQASVPSEFDHLFRDSSPQERRSISARQPVVSGPGAAPSPGFPQQQGQPQQQAAPQMQATQVAPQAANAAMYHQGQQQAPTQGYDAGQQQTQYVGQFGGYDGPGGSGSGGSSGPGNRRTPLIIGGAVVVIAALGLYFGLSGGGGSSGKAPTTKTSATASTNSNETAQQQADAVYQLVKQATTLRSDINGGVDKLLACDISDAKSEIGSTAQARATAASQVAALPVGKLSGGAALVSALQTAWQDSANSDQDYAKAAADFASGNCSGSAVKADANYRAAQSDSGTSEQAKISAATEWNTVMANYEPKITENDL
jgi:hypothetical protein